MDLLFIDDDEITLGILPEILSEQYPIVRMYCKSSFQSGLDFMKEHKPDLILTDHNLDNNHLGTDVIKKAIEFDIPCALLSGKNMKKQMDQISVPFISKDQALSSVIKEIYEKFLKYHL